MEVRQIKHMAFAVRSVEKALADYARFLGVPRDTRIAEWKDAGLRVDATVHGHRAGVEVAADVGPVAAAAGEQTGTGEGGREGEGGDQEGVPNSMLEAMATGLPVVATVHGGIPEAATSGEDGLLVPERDMAGVANALLTIAGHPALYEKLSRTAATSVREKFEQSRSIAKLEGFYRELIEAKLAA